MYINQLEYRSSIKYRAPADCRKLSKNVQTLGFMAGAISRTRLSKLYFLSHLIFSFTRFCLPTRNLTFRLFACSCRRIRKSFSQNASQSRSSSSLQLDFLRLLRYGVGALGICSSASLSFVFSELSGTVGEGVLFDVRCRPLSPLPPDPPVEDDALVLCFGGC